MKRLSPERLAWYRSQRAPLGGWTELLGHIEAIEAELKTAREWAEKWKQTSEKHMNDFGEKCVELNEVRLELLEVNESWKLDANIREERHAKELAEAKAELDSAYTDQEDERLAWANEFDAIKIRFAFSGINPAAYKSAPEDVRTLITIVENLEYEAVEMRVAITGYKSRHSAMVEERADTLHELDRLHAENARQADTIRNHEITIRNAHQAAYEQAETIAKLREALDSAYTDQEDERTAWANEVVALRKRIEELGGEWKDIAYPEKKQ